MPLSEPSADFLRRYNLQSDALETTGLAWDELIRIHDHHESNLSSLEVHGRSIVDQLRSISAVHSLRYRIKNPEHLVAKIIRKKLDRPEFVATLETYRSSVTDLIGIRALHLFKDEWLTIHEFVCKTWELRERPIANVREGDASTIFTELCEIHEHDAGYRSVHYLVKFSPTKEEIVAEVQVRTLFEEAWSEIDHRIRYPHAVNDTVLAQFLIMFNRLAGSADEMGTYVKFLEAHLTKKEGELREAGSKHDAAVAALEDAIARSKLDAEEKSALEQQVQKLASETKRNYGSATRSLATSSLLEAMKAARVERTGLASLLGGLSAELESVGNPLFFGLKPGKCLVCNKRLATGMVICSTCTPCA